MESTDWETVLDQAASAAREWAATKPADRAAVLDHIAYTLERDADELIALAGWECRLPFDGLRLDLRRCTFQLREYARHLRAGRFLGAMVDHADPNWPAGPRPDLRRMLVPVGPVAVFGASAFPFAFSVAGSDTAAALAAGCPVVLKAHHTHPELSDRTAELVVRALAERGAPEGVFALVHGERSGRDLVLDPRIKAVTFIGSAKVGRELYALATGREEPIPFYGGFGSVNPVFVTRIAAARRGVEIARQFVEAYTHSGGQICTKPGVFVVPSTSVLAEAAAQQARDTRVEPLFNTLVAERYEEGLWELRDKLKPLVDGDATADGHTPTLLLTTAKDVLAQPEDALSECFGPVAVVVHYDTDEELLALARALPGQLTATVQGENGDAVVPELLAELAGRAGRVVWNQWPNDVSVTPAMHHGGPYPATTAPHHTTVGVGAIARFQRPVVFQGLPRHLLPDVLREENPLGVPRLEDQ
ncbi:aldehyde dehydrogenase family protein [Lentzea tibetensis]|uniref:aldehyde dehydrogenase family protein n=1 Tax=Lentzea tibetensis TaxID=2591470 RepID=UPI001F20FBB3|nr:aldehyde dehydrogenase family protein [Lentzea tibetensis]